MTSDTATEEDPYTWLEDVEGEKSLDWVRKANDICLETLGNPEGTDSYKRILKVLESKDRIPHATSYGTDPVSGHRVLFNFWKDQDQPKGIWRKTTLEEYQKESEVTGEGGETATTQWETVLDVDALAEQDGKSWVWKGSRALARKRDPESQGVVTRSLLFLSEGGSDAIFVKEFDLTTQSFVTDQPFQLPEAKTRASYKSRNVLLVGSDFGPGSLTDSGYPRTVKEWKRGTAIEDAPVVFEGEATDVAVNAYVMDERNWGGAIWQVHSRSLTFYTSQYWVAPMTEEQLLSNEPTSKDLTFQELKIPEDADMDSIGNLLLISLRSDWTPKGEGGETYASGSAIYCPLKAFLDDGPESVDYQVLFAPTERTALEYYTSTKNYLIVSIMDNVQSKLEFYKIGQDGNSLTAISQGDKGDVGGRIRDCSVRPVDATETDDFWFTTSSYTQPSTLYYADASKVETVKADSEDDSDVFVVQKLKSLPPQYDSSDLIVEQRMATSKDGTQIPYFIVMKKDVQLNGKNPTLLYGYGGFEFSLGPHYIATSGLAWLEKGGVYVEANIRGGGEFGPSWHQAALKEKRNKAYEDFIAVGEDLIATNICKPKTLAVRGGSNGGLLVGNMYTMRPDLFGAIHCAVPLLDMKRFHTLLAGASWMAEYGNPDTDDWDNFLYKYSPYHSIEDEVESYPPLLITTSTKDDRVHPAHARKMVKKLWDMAENGDGKKRDWPVHYYENIEGGHGGAADAKQSAFMTTLAYSWMYETLSKNAEAME